MNRVLGIDTSLTSTGLCQIDIWKGHVEDSPADANVAVATVGAPGPSKDRSKRAMARRVNALIEKIDAGICCPEDPRVPDLIVIEALAYGAKGASAWVLPWVFGRVIELAEKWQIPLLTIATTSRAKYATGKGNADKDTVLLAVAQKWGAKVTNNNEADAFVCAAAGCHYIGMPLRPPTKAMLEVIEVMEP